MYQTHVKMKNQIIEQTDVPDTRKEGIELIELDMKKNQIIKQTNVPNTREEGIELIELYEELDYQTDGCTRHT